MNERNNASPPTNIGISLLLSVFLILCLFTFSAIALVQAKNEWNNAIITRDNRAAYYTAANQAEQDLADMNDALLRGESISSEPIEKSYTINDRRSLYVVFSPVSDASGSYYVFSQFMTVNTSSWDGDDTVNVIR